MESIRDTHTCLSPQVQTLLSIAFSDKSLNLDCVISEDLKLNFTSLQETFNLYLDNDLSKSEYEELVKVSLPIFRSCHEQFMKTDLDKTESSLWWLTDIQTFMECGKLIQENHQVTNVIEALLLMTPIIEQSLGNIYFTSASRKVPALLRDLLQTDELKQALGPLHVQLFKVIIGTPLALNLRNIVWHGFAFPGEISALFASALFTLTTSVEPDKPLRSRDSISLEKSFNIVQYLNKPSEKHLMTDLLSLASDTSCFIVMDRKLPLLERASSAPSIVALSILLPELEHALRIMFTVVNSCPNRLLTAESDELYTTFDEILSEQLPDGSRNNLPEVLGRSVMELLFDMLELPDGPRIRDRIGHGEAQGCGISLKHCIGCVLVAFIEICKISQKLFARQASVSLGTDLEYRSFYHSSAILLRDMLKALQSWERVKSPDLWPSQQELEYEEPSFNDQEAPSSDTLVSLLDSFESPSTLYLPRSELELISIYRRIASASTLCADRTIENLNQKLSMHRGQSLRSRQRITYRRMVETVPRLYCVNLLVFGVAWRLYQNRSNVCVGEKFLKTMKVLKKILKVYENFCSFVHENKNKWEETSKSIDELKNLVVNFDFY